jgi:hypothetical protein
MYLDQRCALLENYQGVDNHLERITCYDFRSNALASGDLLGIHIEPYIFGASGFLVGGKKVQAAAVK